MTGTQRATHRQLFGSPMPWWVMSCQCVKTETIMSMLQCTDTTTLGNQLQREGKKTNHKSPGLLLLINYCAIPLNKFLFILFYLLVIHWHQFLQPYVEHWWWSSCLSSCVPDTLSVISLSFTRLLVKHKQLWYPSGMGWMSLTRNNTSRGNQTCEVSHLCGSHPCLNLFQRFESWIFF